MMGLGFGVWKLFQVFGWDGREQEFRVWDGTLERSHAIGMDGLAMFVEPAPI